VFSHLYRETGNRSCQQDLERRYPGSSTDPHAAKGGLPAGLDIISIDNYWGWSNDPKYLPPAQRTNPYWIAEAFVVRDFYEQYVVDRLLPHQRLLVVPGLFTNGSLSAAAHAIVDHQMVELLKTYWAWISENKHVVGFAPFHWLNRGPNALGAVGFNRTVRCDPISS
jgi:hypothetical protein